MYEKMVSSLKADKEAFVSGLSGTTVLEISLVTVTLSTGYLLRCVAILCIPAIQHFRKSSPLYVDVSTTTTSTMFLFSGFLLFWSMLRLPYLECFYSQC